MVLDSGNIAADPALADVIYRTMVSMGYDTAGVGLLEAGLGPQAAMLAQEAKLPLVGQVSADSAGGRPGRVTRQVAGVQVGIVSAVWVPDPAEEAYRAALLKELEAARAECDFVVLLSELGLPDDEQALSAPGFQDLADVMVGGPLAWPGGEPLWVGRTLLLPGTSKGREVGLLEVQLTGEGIRYYHSVISLDPSIANAPAVQAMVDEYYRARQERPEALPMAAVSDTPPLPDRFTADEAKVIRARGHLTAPECGRCHEEQLKQWRGTQHAQGVQTLWRAQRAVSDCLVCHSEANRRGVPYDPAGADQWGVDCAACHGAGLYHASTNGERDTIVRKPGESVCRRCHTEERDAGFEYSKRLETVVH